MSVEPQYRCDNERRREVVRAAGTLNGIDYVEVGPGQTWLQVVFLQPLPGTGGGAVPAAPALTPANLIIAGGTRVRGIRVTSVNAAANVLTVGVDRPGDFSAYELELVDPLAAGRPQPPPAGFDPRLAVVGFSFKAGCASDFDCAPADACPPQVLPEGSLGYLAKDYDSFLRLMLDRLSTTLPNWTERNPADLLVALVELLAYSADHLSYFQDAVATEAYLGTARRRVSVRRHARLLDYRMHEGCNARTFLHFTATTGLTVVAGHAVLAGPGPQAPVFETMHPVAVRPDHNAIPLYTWSDEECCLPAGATRATLRRTPGLLLAAGDFLLVEETHDPSTLGDPDPTHRQVVRLTAAAPGADPLDGTPLIEVAWSRADALRFPLCVSVQGAVTAVARGNIALADHGATRTGPLPVDDDPPPGRWRPLVPDGPLTWVHPYDAGAPAVKLLISDPRTATAAISLDDGDVRWNAADDLLDAGPTDPLFVVESEDDGETRLRFGDDNSGREPARGTPFEARFRVGNGPPGNLGPDVIDRLAPPVSGVSGVRNPVAATGGTAPEPTERARHLAPALFRGKERAVVEADYAAVADRFEDVQRTAATMRWTGSWYTAFVTVDRVGGGSPDDDDMEERLGAFLDTYRMAGVDVEIDAPVLVPIDLALDVCVRPGYIRAAVEAQVQDVLSARVLPDGRRGFFHPDNFTFGRPLYLSQVFAAVQTAPGVAWTAATTFRRFGRADAGELAAGVLRVHDREIVSLAQDPTFPERGRLSLVMAGGL